MGEAIAKGDEVVIAGGVLGRVAAARRQLLLRRGGQRRRVAGAAGVGGAGVAQGQLQELILLSW